MLEVGDLTPIRVGFWVQNSLNMGPFFVLDFPNRFSLNMGVFSKNWQNIVKNGQFFNKIHHKSGYDGICR